MACPPARPAFAAALKVLASTGAQLIETKLPDFPYSPVIGTIIASESSTVFEPLIQSEKVQELADQKQIAALKAGREILAADYLKAMRIRSQMQEAFSKVFAGVDLLISPSRPGPAPPVAQPLDQPSPPGLEPRSPGLSALIPAGNLAGLPALSLPCGFAGTLPIGIQFVGRPFSENTLLALGKKFQELTDWHRRRPPGL